MKIIFALGALTALAASSQAIVLDDFSTGGFTSPYFGDPVTGYSQTSPASVPGGLRTVGYTKTANPNGEDFRVRVNTARNLLIYTSGVEVDGIGSLSYGDGGDLNTDLSGNSLFLLTIAANDLPNLATLTLTSSTSGTTTRTLNLPVTSTSQVVGFDFSGVDLSDVDRIGFTFDFSPSGDFAVSRFEAVPEPFSLAALASGVAMFGLRRRKR